MKCLICFHLQYYLIQINLETEVSHYKRWSYHYNSAIDWIVLRKPVMT